MTVQTYVPQVLAERTCEVDGCDRKHAAKGLCAMHYYRAQRLGDPGPASPLIPAPRRDLSMAEHLWSRVDRSAGGSGCWEFRGSRMRGGYGEFTHDGRRMGAHRAAWEVANGPIPDGMAVRHKVCDNPPCCNPAHLRIGTHERNMRDKVEHGRQHRPAGERNGSARLTPDEVAEIRRSYAAGVLQRELAARFGISQSHVSKILTEKSWKEAA